MPLTTSPLNGEAKVQHRQRVGRDWLHGLRRFAGRFLSKLPNERLVHDFGDAPHAEPPAQVNTAYKKLDRVVLTDEAARTLFDEYKTHRVTIRGSEETGWLLLGHRSESEAVVLATLPAGAERDAGVAHVQFNSAAQALGSRIVRQLDKKLAILGVVHTHPGSLRHPSSGDYEGDIRWVAKLRGHEGVFGIGTADGEDTPGAWVSSHPKPNVQCLGGLRYSWYSLREGDRSYRPLDVRLTLGPDLARPLHAVWSTLEAHAEQLERLCRELAQCRWEVLSGKEGAVLSLRIGLAQPKTALQVVLGPSEIRYIYHRGGEPAVVDLDGEPVDRAVYQLLAELATRKG